MRIGNCVLMHTCWKQIPQEILSIVDGFFNPITADDVLEEIESVDGFLNWYCSKEKNVSRQIKNCERYEKNPEMFLSIISFEIKSKPTEYMKKKVSSYWKMLKKNPELNKVSL